MKRISIDRRIRLNYQDYSQPVIDLLDNLKVIGAITSSGINRQLTCVMAKYPEVLSDLKRATCFLPEATLVERVVALVENKAAPPTCLRCSKAVSYNKSYGTFNRFCNSRCSGNYITTMISRDPNSSVRD